MKSVLEFVAAIAHKYAVEGAGMPSYRGTYEETVPSILIEQIECKNNGTRELAEYVERFHQVDNSNERKE